MTKQPTIAIIFALWYYISKRIFLNSFFRIIIIRSASLLNITWFALKWHMFIFWLIKIVDTLSWSETIVRIVIGYLISSSDCRVAYNISNITSCDAYKGVVAYGLFHQWIIRISIISSLLIEYVWACQYFLLVLLTH